MGSGLNGLSRGDDARTGAHAGHETVFQQAAHRQHADSTSSLLMGKKKKILCPDTSLIYIVRKCSWLNLVSQSLIWVGTEIPQ